MRINKCFVILPLLFSGFFLRANIRLPHVLANNMVLQQQSVVKLWGWAAPGEKITIQTSWDNRIDSVVGSRDADWMINLQTPAAGGPYTISLSGENRIVLTNVMIGEVWICSGQSNMEWGYKQGLQEIRDELPVCYNAAIRFFTVPKTTSDDPQDDCPGEWTLCDSNSLKSFSAIGYFFGKKLNKELNVPIGLINDNWGGTPAEVWTPAQVINDDSLLSEAAKQLKPYDWWPYHPGRTFNGMIAPLANFTIAGAIWYQGESNTSNAYAYSHLFNKMVDSWRKAWDSEFPFYYVQIAPYRYGNRNVGALVREAQARSMNHGGMGMVVISDCVDDTTNIHPRNKKDPALRLANWALADTYHREGIFYKSPFFRSMTVNREQAVIDFDNVPTELTTRDKKITDLYIAGADKIFYPAESRVEHNRLIVWSRQVSTPAAVRYAFSNTGTGNLFSKEGLPVGPFRTDDWPVDTSAY